jgi:hypothetical protein
MELLQGKKTYLAAGLLVLLGVNLILAGQPSVGMLAILQGLGLVGLGDKANRHQSEILAAIQDAGRIAVDLETKNPAALKEDGSAFVRQVMSVQELKDRLTPHGWYPPEEATAGSPPERAGWVGGTLPSAEDLDQVAQESKAAAATAGSSQ